MWEGMVLSQLRGQGQAALTMPGVCSLSNLWLEGHFPAWDLKLSTRS